MFGMRNRPADPSAPGLVPWEFAGLLLTYGCTARCDICYLCAGPEHGGYMDRNTALDLWRGLDAHAAAQQRGMRIHLAGGEPFLAWPELRAIVQAAHAAGCSRLEKVETNAFWAVEDGLVRERLTTLDELGMERLVVSSDIFHQQYVPFDRVRRCVEIARDVLGLGRVIVRWWDYFNDPIDPHTMAPEEYEDVVRAELARHIDRMAGRAACKVAHLLPHAPPDAFAHEDCRGEVLHSRHVHVDRYGNIFPGTCGGIILGQARTRAHPQRPTVDAVWRQLAGSWREHPVVGAVAGGGSYALMQRACRLGYVPRPEGYANKCHLCTDVRAWLAANGHWPAAVGPAECYAGVNEYGAAGGRHDSTKRNTDDTR